MLAAKLTLHCQQMNQKFCLSRVCVLLWFGFGFFWLWGVWGFFWVVVVFCFFSIFLVKWQHHYDLSLQISFLLEQFPHSHPPTCLPSTTSRFPFLIAYKGRRAQCQQGVVLFRDAYASLQESSQRPCETQLHPSRWSYLSCPFLFVWFLLSWHFYWNSEKPSQVFLHRFRKIIPKLINPKPFCTTKIKNKKTQPSE